jgi:4-hydroxy-4-methyl-2-oxoglutarate aldolase
MPPMNGCTCSPWPRPSTVVGMIPVTWTTAAVVDACVHLAIEPRVAPPGLKPLEPGMRVHGRVLPARHFGSVDVFLEALMGARTGDVLVIDNGGLLEEGCIGDLIVLETKNAGVDGIVVWGAHRDSVELRRIGLPVFSYSTVPNGPLRMRPRTPDALERAQIGAASVRRDDLVFADDDGAVFVAEGDLPNVLREAEAIVAQERQQVDLTRQGTSLREQFGFADYLARRTADAAYTFREHLRRRGNAVEE